jgi:predicted AlkP superfamily pyrophosphatase or phosphodiesterase
MKKKLFAAFFFLIILGIYAQPVETSNNKPRLIVGIVVDQMRNDFIYRFWDRYGNGGFKRLVNEGYYFKNTHYDYVPTFTGPGHCSIYTGTTPRMHGIIANEWYIKSLGKEMYCCFDSTAKTIGYGGKNGMMSPANQLSSTIGDEMKITSSGKAKVIGIALKDRSAILPAGHAANGAYWYDDESGNFISSSWYMNDLPAWIKAFNEKKLPKQYLEGGWNTLYGPEGYSASLPDDNNYEAAPNKKEKPTFPYSYKSYLDKNSFGIIKSTPFGNTLTKDLAIECIKKEDLGKDNITDLFCISFSSSDIVSHAYGPRSMEVEDVYLRLDKDLEELLNTLDKEVGKNNYTVFLTADHGGADVPNHLKDNKIPAGYINKGKLTLDLKTFFKNNYGDSALLSSESNEQIFLNEKKLGELKLNKDEVEERVCAFLLKMDGVAEAYPSKVMKHESFAKNDMRTLLQNGYNHRLSGNVCFVYKPAWMEWADKGTTHGAGYNYDTHVPLIFYGWGIKKGNTVEQTYITQIAPTVCELIQVNQPNSTKAEPLNEKFK